LYHAQASFASDEQIRTVIDRIISPLGRRIDEQNPLVNGRLPEGHRVNAIIPPLALEGPSLTIRKFRDKVFSLQELCEHAALPPVLVTFLQWAVLARQNIAVTGGTGSGKTTFLNALSLVIPPSERLVTIEDSAELKFSFHPNLVRLEARPANLEGRGAVTIRDLVINSLRMRPDRIVVGEVRGDEALEMLQAMNTGHDGSLTTLHANSPREVIARLVTMVGYGSQLPAEQIERQIASALDLIVHLARLSGGRRQVVEIAELHEPEDDVPAIGAGSNRENRGRTGLQPIRIAHFEQEGVGDDGLPRGRWVLDRLPAFFELLVSRGIASVHDVEQWEVTFV
jgi:pilus assembly protein CpaF